MTTEDRDVFDVNVYKQPSRLPESGELYWGTFRERIRLQERPSIDRPLRLLGWMLGKRTLVKTVHLVQDFSHSPVEEYDNAYFVDSFIEPVDVSVYGPASAMYAVTWPTEEQVSSEEVIEEYEQQVKLMREQDEAMGL
jgi:hypothetical protein